MENNRLAVILGILSSIAVIVLAAWGVTSDDNKIFMNGELSQKHSALESDCTTCHKPWDGVTWKSCVDCHDDKMHVKKVGGGEEREGYGQLKICLSCHNEHKGRSHNLTMLNSGACEQCHIFDKHPEKVSGTPTVNREGTILFTHLPHYDAGTFELDMCGFCHLPSDDDGTFINANFDEACGLCHKLDEHDSDTKVTETCKYCHENNKFRQGQHKNVHATLTRDSHESHVKVDCNQCHHLIPPIGETVVSTNPPVSDCISCHEKKLVDNRCGSCHSFHTHE